jgi:hypothetical protein
VHYDGINESCEEHGIAKIRHHLASLGQGAGDNGYTGSGEGVFEKPKGLIDFARAEKVGHANKRNICAVILPSEGKGVAKTMKRNGGAAGIEQVLEHGILQVLFTDASSTEHGETSLHEKHQGTGKHQKP